MILSKRKKKHGYFDQTASQAPTPSPPFVILVTSPKLVFSTFQMILSKKKKLAILSRPPHRPRPLDFGHPNFFDFLDVSDDFEQKKKITL